jgi:rod shape determining protein RodA
MYAAIAGHRLPKALIAAALGLMLSGWLAIARSDEIAGAQHHLVGQQIVWSVVGSAVMIAFALVDYRRLSRHAALAYAGITIALLAVYSLPAVNGAHRWIRIGGIGIQPSEFAKLVFIVALARYLMHRDVAASVVSGVLCPLAMAIVPLLLILKEPDLGTSLVFLPVLFAMLWAAGARARDLVCLTLAGIMFLPLLWSQMSREQRSRVTALWEQNAPREPATADGFHLDQAKRMFALGGVWGSYFISEEDDSAGLLSVHVPEPHTDSIYCVVGERFGLVGAGLVLTLYMMIVGGCLSVAAATEEPFGRLIAVGVAALFGAEATINTGMLVGLLPITGLSLPLVSYGGSNLVAHLMAVGLIANVGRRADCRLLRGRARPKQSN